MDSTEKHVRDCKWQIGDSRVDPTTLTIDGPTGGTCIEPMVMDVLLVLVAHAGTVVNRSDLIEAVWQTEFGGDERLTRAISLLRKALGDNHGVRRAIETVPKRGYRLIADVAPISEATDRRPDPGFVPDARSPGKQGGPVRWYAGIGASLAALAAVSLAWLSAAGPDAEPATGSEVRTVAAGRVEIGAFQTGSRDPAVQAMVHSMPANMTAILSEAGIETAAAGAARETHAEFRIRGQVQSEGETHRAFVEVFDTVDGVVVWSDTFERAGAEALNLANQVGASAAWIMRCSLGVRGSAIDAPSDAFRQYARFCGATREKAQMKNLPAFTEAILRLEPDRPTAMGLHAWAMAQQAMWDDFGTEADRTTRFNQASAMADDALERSPDNPYAHLAKAAVLSASDDQIGAIRSLETASRSSDAPAQAITTLAYQYRRVGRIADAQMLLARSLAIDPFDVYARTQFALMHSLRGNKSEAHRQFDRVARDNPDWWELYWRKLQVELFSGDAVAGLDYLERVVSRRSPIDDSILNCARAFSEARLAEIPDIAAFTAVCDGEVQADWRARMHAVLGDLDQAFAAMGEFPTDMDDVTVVFFYPEMEAFREDERFWPMAAQFGLVDYWIETDSWPDFCGDERLDYDCRRRARLTQRSTTIQ